jgi:hypothetical protein
MSLMKRSWINIGALHSYIRHTLLLFNPTNLDEVCVQATHLESRGNNVQEDHKHSEYHFKRKGKGKDKRTTTTKKEGEKSSCTHCQKDGHDDEHCWKLHPELRPKRFGGQRKQKIVATVQQDLGSDSGDEEKITTVGLQGKVSLHASSSSKIPSLENDERRSELFHIRVVTKHTKVESLGWVHDNAKL